MTSNESTVRLHSDQRDTHMVAVRTFDAGSLSYLPIHLAIRIRSDAFPSTGR